MLDNWRCNERFEKLLASTCGLEARNCKASQKHVCFSYLQKSAKGGHEALNKKRTEYSVLFLFVLLVFQLLFKISNFCH
jgi:hypothetical protein